MDEERELNRVVEKNGDLFKNHIFAAITKLY
jgi:hypothetical protein